MVQPLHLPHLPVGDLDGVPILARPNVGVVAVGVEDLCPWEREFTLREAPRRVSLSREGI